MKSTTNDSNYLRIENSVIQHPQYCRVFASSNCEHSITLYYRVNIETNGVGKI